MLHKQATNMTQGNLAEREKLPPIKGGMRPKDYFSLLIVSDGLRFVRKKLIILFNIPQVRNLLVLEMLNHLVNDIRNTPIIRFFKLFQIFKV